MKKGSGQSLRAKVDRLTIRADGDACWLWGGTIHHRGYGALHHEGRMVGAHRAAWEVEFGASPGSLQVCHHCDNPRCVRPSHLFLGTGADNMRDKVSKGRQARGDAHGRATVASGLHALNRPRGDRHGHAKLPVKQRAEVVAAAAIASQSAVAARYGISRSRVGQLCAEARHVV